VTDLATLGVTWSDGVPVGYQVGRNAALLDWQHKREDAAFDRLVQRLLAKRYWAAKNPASKARIRAYCRQWHREHWEHCREMVREWKRRRRSKDPAYRARETAQQRERRAKARELRCAATVYTCLECGAQWSPVGRVPSREPLYCSHACGSRHRYWAKKGASHDH